MIEAFHHHTSFNWDTQGLSQFTINGHQGSSGIYTPQPLFQSSPERLAYTIVKNIPQKALSASQAKCKLCDLIRHHSHHVYLSDQQTIIFNTLLLQTLSWHFILQCSSSFILACANKGPPASI